MSTQAQLVRADGALLIVAAKTGRKDRAYAMYRICINGVPEDFSTYLVRLFSAMSEGGVVLPGGAHQNPTIKSEVYDTVAEAAKRCEQWLDGAEAIVRPDAVVQ